MRYRSRLSPESEIPTSSTADIAFLLIVFFMVTAVFASSKGLETSLPGEEPLGTDPDPAVLIHVKTNGMIVDCRSMTRSDLEAYLTPKLERNPAKPVVIYTDGDAPYQGMIDVFDELSRLDVRNVHVPIRSEIDAYIAQFDVDPFATACD